MAYLVATTTGGKNIKVEFNDATPLTGVVRGSWVKASIIIQQMPEGFIKIFIKDHPTWAISFGMVPGCVPVTSINGVEPTSLDHLFELLSDALNT